MNDYQMEVSKKHERARVINEIIGNIIYKMLQIKKEGPLMYYTPWRFVNCPKYALSSILYLSCIF